MSYTTLHIEIADHIATISINRPDKANSLNQVAFDELTQAFEEMDENEEVRVVVLSGNGKHFCAGIDLSLLLGLNDHIKEACEGRKREKLRKLIFRLQAPMSAAAACRKPIIAAIDGGCIGAGLDLVSACDMRFTTETAYFTIKEIDMGMVADLGVLQRLPGIVSDGFLREMAFTGRKVDGAEAAEKGLANACYPDRASMMEAVHQLAAQIASKSPLSIRGTKEILNYGREHSLADSLNYIATWNAAMILSEDLAAAGQAAMMKMEPKFRN